MKKYKKCLKEPNKNRYNTKKAAETAILIANNKNLRIYECAACNGWHLTSKREPNGSDNV